MFVHVVSPYSFQEHATIVLLRTHFLHCCRDIRCLVLLRAQKSEGLSASKPRESLVWKRLERRLPSWTKRQNNRKPYAKLCNLALRRLPGIQSHGQKFFSLPIQGMTLHVFFVYQQRSASCSGTYRGTCVHTIKSLLILLTLLTWCVCCSCGSAMVTAQHWELALSAPAGHYMRLCPNLRFKTEFRKDQIHVMPWMPRSRKIPIFLFILVELRFGCRWHRTNARGRCSRRIRSD